MPPQNGVGRIPTAFHRSKAHAANDLLWAALSPDSSVWRDRIQGEAKVNAQSLGAGDYGIGSWPASGGANGTAPQSEDGGWHWRHAAE